MNEYPSNADCHPGEYENRENTQPRSKQPFDRQIQKLVCIDAMECEKRVHQKRYIASKRMAATFQSKKVNRTVLNSDLEARMLLARLAI